MTKNNVVSSDEVSRRQSKAPVTRLIETVGDEYKTYKDMAARYGVHVETMRRVCRLTDENGVERIKAPSKAVVNGAMVVYLFDEDDVKELDAYFENRGVKAQE